METENGVMIKEHLQSLGYDVRQKDGNTVIANHAARPSLWVYTDGQAFYFKTVYGLYDAAPSRSLEFWESLNKVNAKSVIACFSVIADEIGMCVNIFSHFFGSDRERFAAFIEMYFRDMDDGFEIIGGLLKPHVDNN